MIISILFPKLITDLLPWGTLLDNVWTQNGALSDSSSRMSRVFFFFWCCYNHNSVHFKNRFRLHACCCQSNPTVWIAFLVCRHLGGWKIMLSEFSLGHRCVFKSVSGQMIYKGDAHFWAHLFLLMTSASQNKTKVHNIFRLRTESGCQWWSHHSCKDHDLLENWKCIFCFAA